MGRRWLCAEPHTRPLRAHAWRPFCASRPVLRKCPCADPTFGADGRSPKAQGRFVCPLGFSACFPLCEPVVRHPANAVHLFSVKRRAAGCRPMRVAVKRFIDAGLCRYVGRRHLPELALFLPSFSPWQSLFFQTFLLFAVVHHTPCTEHCLAQNKRLLFSFPDKCPLLKRLWWCDAERSISRAIPASCLYHSA